MPLFNNRAGNAGSGKGFLVNLGHKMMNPTVKQQGAAYDAKRYGSGSKGMPTYEQDRAARGLLGTRTFNDGSPMPPVKGGLSAAPGMKTGPQPLQLPKAPGA